MPTTWASKPATVLITFALPASIWAERIQLVGDFNGWNPTATPLRLAEHAWEATVALRPGRTYRYGYLLDGRSWDGAQPQCPEEVERACGTRLIRVPEDAAAVQASEDLLACVFELEACCSAA